MSKFCTNCGTALDDNTAFCTSCGAAVVNEAPVVPETPAAPANPIKKFLNKKMLIIGGAIVAAIIAVVGIIHVVNAVRDKNLATPEAAVKNYVALLNGKVEAYQKTAPEAYWEYLADKSGCDSVEDYFENKEDYIEDHLDGLEDVYGDDYKVTYKIKKEEDVDDDMMEEIVKALEMYDIDEDSIEDAKQLKIKLTIDGEDDKESNTNKIYVLKIDGAWYFAQVYENLSIDGGVYVTFGPSF